MAFLRRALIRFGLEAFYLSGVHKLFAPLASGRGMILMLHRVRPARTDPFQPHAHLEVTPDYLAGVLARIRAAGIPIVGLDEAHRRLTDPADKSRFVAVTFDDGYRDNHQYAWPVLRAAGAPFTVFVATGLVDGTANYWWAALEEVVRRTGRLDYVRDGEAISVAAATPAEKHAAMRAVGLWLEALSEPVKDAFVRDLAARHGVDIPAMLAADIMNWGEIAEMAADPLVTIGGHTVSHPALARISATAALREMSDGAAEIERRIGARPVHFAYPYGYASAAGPREFVLAERAGFKLAVTTRPGVLPWGAGTTLMALPRLSLNGNYQAVRYLDVFLSGAPFTVYNGLRRLTHRRGGTASAVLPGRGAIHPLDEVAGGNDP